MAMTPSLRKFALTVHVTSSVGLLGAIASFLVLALAGVTTQDSPTIRAVYPAMELVARFIIVPLAFASLITGLVQSLGTAWGLFRHYWILAKFSLTVFATTVLLIKLELIGYAAHLATHTNLPYADLHAAGMQLAVHAAGGLLVLLVPAILSEYKPQGLTRYGRRKQHELRSASQQLFPTPLPRSPHSNGDIQIPSRSGSITITIRRAQIFGLIAFVFVLHVVVLHVAGIGLGNH